MGLLEKAMKVAAVAKEVREVHAMARVRPEGGGVLDEHEEAVVVRAMGLGAPEPWALLSVEEASEVVGVPLGGPRLVYGDDTIGVSYAAAVPGKKRWSVEVQAFHAVDDDTRFDAAVHWHTYVAEHVSADGRLVEGLGDAAIARDGEAFVLAGPLLFFATVRVPDDDDQGSATDKAIAAARCTTRRVAR
jgi:hypothetical protein